MFGRAFNGSGEALGKSDEVNTHTKKGSSRPVFPAATSGGVGNASSLSRTKENFFVSCERCNILTQNYIHIAKKSIHA